MNSRWRGFSFFPPLDKNSERPSEQSIIDMTMVAHNVSLFLSMKVETNWLNDWNDEWEIYWNCNTFFSSLRSLFCRIRGTPMISSLEISTSLYWTTRWRLKIYIYLFLCVCCDPRGYTSRPIGPLHSYLLEEIDLHNLSMVIIYVNCLLPIGCAK